MACAQKTPNSLKGFGKGLLKEGEGGELLVVVNFLVSESFVFAAIHVGQVSMFP